MRLLFLENHEPFSTAVVREFLSSHIVNICPNLSTAGELFDQNNYDMALVDFDIDDGKGSEFVAYLRSIGSDLPIIAVSSHDIGNESLINAGANDTCSKMQFRDIEKTIERVLSARQE